MQPILRCRFHAALLATALGWCSTAHAYRTAGDLEDFEGTERVAWPSGVTSFVLVDRIPGVVGGVDASLHLARQALRVWEDVACTSVIASLKGTTSFRAAFGDGVNSIQWVESGWEELGFQPGASGATDLRYEERDGQWVIAEADVYLNLNAHSWITGIADEDAEDGVAEIIGVMTHEFGHALGLLHPCEEGGEPECTKSMTTNPATMYPEYSHGQLALKKDDIAGICFLYPACDPESCAEGEVCTKNGCAVVCGDETCQAGELCIEERCVDWRDPCQIAPESCVSCEVDEDCEKGFECRREVCAPRSVANGDPCGDGAICAGGVCGEADYCVPPCGRDADCGKGGKCDAESGLCSTDSREPFGGECDSADDCLGERCLADLTKEPLCTRPCRPEKDDCPFGWVCDEVEEQFVCVPGPDRTVSHGCSTARAPSRAPSSLFSLGGLLVALAVAHRAMRRGHRSL